MNRKPTDPGQPAPPAPGSVGPMFGPPPNAYTEEEIPTKRDNTFDPETLKLVRVLSDMPTVERRRFVSMAEHYVRCPLSRRVLLEELAREFAGKGT